jgi:hypothetical protein
MLGLLALPIVFVWFLFRRGYSKNIRVAALTYTFAIPIAYIVAATAAALLSTSQT